MSEALHSLFVSPKNPCNFDHVLKRGQYQNIKKLDVDTLELAGLISTELKTTTSLALTVIRNNRCQRCLTCNKLFVDITKSTCSNRCSVIKQRKELKADPIRLKIFSNNLHEIVTNHWASLDDEQFKKRAKMGGYVKTLKGFYEPKNPSKYRGDVKSIVYRSSWERRFMVVCDETPEIVGWSSEELIIPYRDPSKDNTIHRYFPDFVIHVKQPNGIEKRVVEIKPYKETQMPVKKKRVTKAYMESVYTYVRNQAKWEAARAYCASQGMKFVVLTENELFPKPR